MRVLLVDDDEDVQQILSRYLQQDGHQVVSARSGAQALAAVSDAGIDVAVLDLTLPDLDGLEVLRRVRSGPQKDLPILLLTARGEEPDRLLGLGLGADDYVGRVQNLVENAGGALLPGSVRLGVHKKGVAPLASRVPEEAGVRGVGSAAGVQPGGRGTDGGTT